MTDRIAQLEAENARLKKALEQAIDRISSADICWVLSNDEAPELADVLRGRE